LLSGLVVKTNHLGALLMLILLLHNAKS
jgi:hypothetical protein